MPGLINRLDDIVDGGAEVRAWNRRAIERRPCSLQVYVAVIALWVAVSQPHAGDRILAAHSRPDDQVFARRKLADWDVRNQRLPLRALLDERTKTLPLLL